MRNIRLTSKHASAEKQIVLTSFRRLPCTSASGFQGFPSTISGDGCNDLAAPDRVLLELVLLSPLVETEHVVSLLSVDEGDVTRFGLDRLREVVSLKDFLCCTFSGLGLAAALELRAFPLRTDLIVLCRALMLGTLFA